MALGHTGDQSFGILTQYEKGHQYHAQNIVEYNKLMLQIQISSKIVVFRKAFYLKIAVSGFLII